jgi:hypothetical protein
MKQKPEWKIRQAFLAAWAIVALVAGLASTVPSAYAGGTIKADEDKWISVGVGMRASFNAVENGSPDGSSYSKNFAINNARIYINGQLHKYIKFTFNTECFNCAVSGGNSDFGGNSQIGLLDAIAKFEYREAFNVWAGRTLIPSERGELNGPYYHQTFEGFKTPFNSADFSGNFPNGPANAGLYGRDNGVVFFGKFHPMGTHLLYAGMVSTGLRGAANQEANLMYSGRLQWNLLNDEDNPGYYTSGGYYGTAGNIIAPAINFFHQKDGAGTAANRSDHTAFIFDFLGEYLVPGNLGVLTINGEFKRYWAQDVNAWNNAAAGNACFCTFGGNSWTVYALYLLPNQMGWGKLQPYGRYTQVAPTASSLREEWEAGANYVIDGYNARVSAFWQYGDLATKGLNYAPGAAGNRVDAFKVAFQWQY